MYVIRLVDCASGVVRYVTRVKGRNKGKEVCNQFETTHKIDKISKSAKYRTYEDASKALDKALNNKEYWDLRYKSEIIKVEDTL